MPNKTDDLIVRIEALLLSEAPDSEALHTAAAALLKQYNRQSRQIDRLVKLSDARDEQVAGMRHRNPAPLYVVTDGEDDRSQDIVAGSGDGFRLFLDSAVLSDRETALSLLRQAIRQIEEQDDSSA